MYAVVRNLCKQYNIWWCFMFYSRKISVRRRHLFIMMIYTNPTPDQWQFVSFFSLLYVHNSAIYDDVFSGGNRDYMVEIRCVFIVFLSPTVYFKFSLSLNNTLRFVHKLFVCLGLGTTLVSCQIDCSIQHRFIIIITISNYRTFKISRLTCQWDGHY